MERAGVGAIISQGWGSSGRGVCTKKPIWPDLLTGSSRLTLWQVRGDRRDRTIRGRDQTQLVSLACYSLCPRLAAMASGR